MSIEKIINLGKNESIELIIDRSLWAWYRSIFFGCLLIITAFFFMFPLFSLGKYGIVSFILINLIGIIFLLRVYISQKGTVFVMTNYRIADIEQKGFINRKAVEIPFDRVMDIEYSRKSLFDLILGLGDIFIALDDNKSKIKLTKIKNCKRVVNEIFLQLNKHNK